MSLYYFRCVVCDNKKEFFFSIKEVPMVGETISMPPEDECQSCQANRWQRIWPKKAGSFKFNMRRTSI